MHENHLTSLGSNGVGGGRQKGNRSVDVPSGGKLKVPLSLKLSPKSFCIGGEGGIQEDKGW
jgi:hypothetical protein